MLFLALVKYSTVVVLRSNSRFIHRFLFCFCVCRRIRKRMSEQKKTLKRKERGRGLDLYYDFFSLCLLLLFLWKKKRIDDDNYQDSRLNQSSCFSLTVNNIVKWINVELRHHRRPVTLVFFMLMIWWLREKRREIQWERKKEARKNVNETWRSTSEISSQGSETWTKTKMIWAIDSIDLMWCNRIRHFEKDLLSSIDWT